MIRIFLASIVLLLLAACAGTAPSSQTVLTIACAADKLAPGLTKAGAAIAQIADPTIVDQLAQATEAEALANAAVQAGCNAALAGSKPTAVMPTLAPVGAPPGSVVSAAAPAS